MLRLLLLILLLYVGWKIVQSFLRRAASKKLTDTGHPRGSFDHIEDAEFEDVTNKRQDPPLTGQEKHE